MTEVRLDSWKEIAAHLGRSVRTVQRWERQEGLPVHRLQHEKQGSVYAFAHELDAWWDERKVRLESSEPEPEAAEVEDAAPARRGTLAATAGALVVLLLAAVVWRSVAPATVPGRPARLAILPFANMTGDAARDYISDGLTEELIATLGRVKDLGVIARTSVMKFKSTTRTVSEISRELAADYVLEGSVRESGPRLRITAQLVRSGDETHLWAETYDREPKDLLAVQGEVALRVAREIRRHVPPRAAPGTDPEAYLAYLRGRSFLARRSAEGFRRAAEEFEAALARDARFAPAWSGLADTRALSSNYGYARPREAMPRAGEAARKAVALDPELAEGHASLGFVLANYEWDFPAAERELARAIELNPSAALIHLWYGQFLNRVGRTPEARRAYERGLEADPLSEVLSSSLYEQDFWEGRYEVSLRRIQADLDRAPEDAFTLLRRARVEAALGRPREAAATMRKASELRGEDAMFAAYLAYAQARSGETGAARAALAALTRKAAAASLPPYYLALVSVGLGDRDGALGFLEQAYEQRHVGALSIKTDPEFAPLRADPRFQDLLRRAGL